MMSTPAPPEEEHWTYKLYVKNANLYLSTLESRKEIGVKEAQGIDKILRDAGGEKRKVLDLACGIGRHSIPLAKMGYEVVGYDLSQFFLDRGEASAAQEGLGSSSLRFYQGDLRRVAEVLKGVNETGFGAILNLFGSLGSYGEEEDVKLFKNLREISNPDCLLLIETLNRDLFVKKFQPFVIQRFSQHLRLLELKRLNLETSTVEDDWRFYTETPEGNLKLELIVQVTDRIYTLLELKRLLTDAKWSYVGSQGSLLQPVPVTQDSPSMLLLGRKQ